MSVMNDDFIGDEQSPARANALGDLEDASVSAHFPLHHNGGHEFKTTKENLKLKCPRRECKEVCHTREELDKHQWKKCHYRCVTCEMDFPDEDTQFVHNSKIHKERQDIACPGCGIKFNTAGALMGHVEENHCPRIHPSMLHDRRQVQIDFGRKLRAMNPANDEFKVVIDMQNMALGDQKQDASKPSDAYNPPYTRPDARIVNYTLNPEDFPKLGKDLEDDRSGNSSKPDLLTGEARPKPIIPPVKKFENQWVKGETLFQDSAPVVRPTPGQLDRFPNALHSERDFDPKERVNDPDDPRFNPGVFWHPIMRQFVCVHAPKCKSKFHSARALIDHLNSKVHRECVVFKCPRCLRDYRSMASAIAHAETATRICNIRETDDFRKFIDHVSGGMLDGLNGPNECLDDGGPRFIIPKTFYENLPFTAHIHHKQTEQDAKLGRGRMMEWEDPEDDEWVEVNEFVVCTDDEDSKGW